MGYGECVTAYVSLGSNVEDATTHLNSALDGLRCLPSVHALTASERYFTEPQDDSEQPWFVNQVAQLTCDAWLGPEALLADMLALEHRLGRVRKAGRRFGPRVIDLDLLLFGDEVRKADELCLPHPRMALRAFVLVPLYALEKDLQLPDGRSIAVLLNNIAFRVEGNRIYQSPIAEISC